MHSSRRKKHGSPGFPHTHQPASSALSKLPILHSDLWEFGPAQPLPPDQICICPCELHTAGWKLSGMLSEPRSDSTFSGC